MSDWQTLSTVFQSGIVLYSKDLGSDKTCYCPLGAVTETSVFSKVRSRVNQHRPGTYGHRVMDVEVLDITDNMDGGGETIALR